LSSLEPFALSCMLTLTVIGKLWLAIILFEFFLNLIRTIKLISKWWYNKSVFSPIISRLHRLWNYDFDIWLGRAAVRGLQEDVCRLYVRRKKPHYCESRHESVEWFLWLQLPKGHSRGAGCHIHHGQHVHK